VLFILSSVQQWHNMCVILRRVSTKSAECNYDLQKARPCVKMRNLSHQQSKSIQAFWQFMLPDVFVTKSTVHILLVNDVALII